MVNSLQGRRRVRKFFGKLKEVAQMPNLIEVQKASYDQFLMVDEPKGGRGDEGLQSVFKSVFPIGDFSGASLLEFVKYTFEPPKYDVDECRQRGMTFSAPLKVTLRLIVFDIDPDTQAKSVKDIKEQDVYMGDMPLMTDNGTFIVNGTERVIVSQMHRSPGVFFDHDKGKTHSSGKLLFAARIIPYRGSWLDIEFDAKDIVYARIDRKRKIPVTSLLFALGMDGEEILSRFYNTITYTRDAKGWRVPYDAERMKGFKATVDLIDADTGEVVVEAGKKLVARTARQLAEKGLKFLRATDEDLVGQYIAEDLVDFQTGEVHAEAGEELTMSVDAKTGEAKGNLVELINKGYTEIPVLDIDHITVGPYIRNTLAVDKNSRREEALFDIYRVMRPGEPPTLETAENMFQSLFFDAERYDLSAVGRVKMNMRLDLDAEDTVRILRKEDIFAVVKALVDLRDGKGEIDDIDHLGNRRVRSVGELMENQYRLGLLRMERAIKERMSSVDIDTVMPQDLINAKPAAAAVREFFGSSQLSQFMDQTNPLSEVTHKRRLSALGPGGLTRERAGFEVRDVHPTHYGRICPIETPEGPNIGLINSLATFARVNKYGFIESPYRRIRDGRQTDEIIYLSAMEEAKYNVAQANAAVDKDGRLTDDLIVCRRAGEVIVTPVDKVDFQDVSPKQLVSVAAALIPFLEHDDANRALMGSNMQRQAVPLLRPEAPIVGTGIERQAAVDSGQVLVAEQAGEVISSTSEKIRILEEDGTRREYPLRKYQRSNQSTCIDQRPVVQKGDRVAKGQVIADSSSTDFGEMALGQNVLVAFLSWEGGNYEDAILISERMVQEDKFTSIHIEKHEVEARDTKLGAEEITRDIPNVGEDALKDLDEVGIVRIGAVVSPGDILVGKITPKGETELTPEEKLLRAIFGEKAREVKDSSLRLPHGEYGKVVDIKEFSRDEHRDLPAGVERMVRVSVAQRRKTMEGDKMAGRHGNKGVISRIVPIEDMPFLPDGTPVDIILNPLGVPARMNIGQVLETHLGWAAQRLGFRAETPVFDGARELEIEAELARAWLADRAWEKATRRAWDWAASQGLSAADLRDDDEVRAMYLAEWLGERGYDPERVYRDMGYARRAMLREWLREEPQNYDPDALLFFPDDQRSLGDREASNELARLVCLREWLKWITRERMRFTRMEPQVAIAEDGTEVRTFVEIPETLEERAAVYAEMERLSRLTDDEVVAEALRISRETGEPLPTWGKTRLYNGKTGEPFDSPVTVGIIHMMKLHHLVEDKVHARSTGPYSLVTQQPLGGKAQFGGQRFGEMEVWALEAYGAAHSLQEMLTVKSDDVTGRVKTYEAIVKGEPIEAPGVPESFRVLVKELQSLGLAVEVVDAKEEVIQFGREDTEEKLPNLGFSLSLPGPMGKGLE